MLKQHRNIMKKRVEEDTGLPPRMAQLSKEAFGIERQITKYEKRDFVRHRD